MGHVGPVFGHLGPVSGLSWAILSPSWACLGDVLGYLRPVLGCLWLVSGFLGPFRLENAQTDWGRVAGSLKTLAEVDPERPVAVCRELTKVHEEVTREIGRAHV